MFDFGLCVFGFGFMSYLSYFRFFDVYFGYFGYKKTELEHDPFIYRFYMDLDQLHRTGPNPMGSEPIPYWKVKNTEWDF